MALIVLKERSLFELTLASIAIFSFSAVSALVGAASLKYLLLLLVAFAGILLIVLCPARKVLCVCLWVIIQPLSIEKILFTATPIWNGLRGYEVVLNAGDLILLVLACILIYEKVVLNKSNFLWDKFTKLLFLLFCWSVCSYLVHLLFLQSEFIHSAPLGILHLFRNFFFVFIIGSAIQSRNDLLVVLATIASMVLIQSILVGISFATGESMNFSRLLGPALKLQEYKIDGETVRRAAGTLGVPNQQASYHAMFTFLCVGLLSAKNILFRMLALLAIMASLFAVIFTFSRTAWLTMALATILTVVIFIKRKEIKPSGLLIGGLLAVMLIVGLAIVAKPIVDRLTKGDDGATDSRVRMIMLATDLIQKHPLIGVGPNDYSEAGLYYYPPGEKEVEWVALGEKAIVPPLGRIELAVLKKPGEKPLAIPLGVHNKYLLVFSELGLAGLILWIAILIVVFKYVYGMRGSKDKLLQYMSVSGYAVLLVASLYMMLDLFADDKTLQVLLFPLTFLVAAHQLHQQQALRPEASM